MSALESGSTSMEWVPVAEDLLTVTGGAGFVMAPCIVYNCSWCWSWLMCRALAPGLGCKLLAASVG